MHGSTMDRQGGSTVGADALVPQSRNPDFVGRERVFEILRNSFAEGQLVQVVYGAGGVGKTQLAIEYAYRERERYRTIAWLPAGEPNTLSLRFHQLAERLRVAPPDALAEEARQALREALAKRSDWLLIFDDAPDPAAIAPYLPGGGGHVLVTSRNTGWQQFGMPYCLRVLERSESKLFLQHRLGPVSERALGTLAQALGDLPLALEQAGAVIREVGLRVDDYLHRYEDLWAELLQSGRSSGDYPDSVAMTFELACRELAHWDAEVSGLTKLLAFLAPMEIPHSLLQRMLSNLPLPFSRRFATSAAIRRAVDMLRRFSLMSADEEGVSVHPAIAALTRDHTPADQRANWCSAALRMMAATFRFEVNAMDGWSDCADALPHVLAVSQHAEALSVLPDVHAKMLNEVGEYLAHMGRIDQARRALEQALALTEKAHGHDDPRRAAIINNLGRVLNRAGALDQAKAHFEQALVLDQASYGEAHPHVAEIVNNYATALHRSGDVETALRQFEWALEVCRNAYGDDHIKVAIVTNNLGYTRATIGDPGGALEAFNTALGTAEAAVGTNHPIVASILTNIGAVLLRGDQPDAARDPLERAATIHAGVFGAAHPEVARNFSHLGHLHRRRAELGLAVRYFERALRIDQATLGESHPLLVGRLEDFGRCLKEAGDVDASAACFERIALIRRTSQQVA